MLFNELKKISFLILTVCIIGCTSGSAENEYPTNDAAAIVFYDATLKSIIADKCINCHNYHLEGSNRYDSYSKTKSTISQMLKRINVASNISMPPDEAPQLKTEEKQIFQQFFDILISGTPPTEPQIELTWTVYKYPNYEERAAVSGTFDEIEYTLNETYVEPVDMLKNSTVSINTSSVMIDGADGIKTTTVKAGFFAFFSPEINGKVIKYTTEEAIIRFNMNGIDQDILFDISMGDDKLILKGTIPDLNSFNWANAYIELEKVCGEAHQNKVWPDVDLELEIPIKS